MQIGLHANRDRGWLCGRPTCNIRIVCCRCEILWMRRSSHLCPVNWVFVVGHLCRSLLVLCRIVSLKLLEKQKPEAIFKIEGTLKCHHFNQNIYCFKYESKMPNEFWCSINAMGEITNGKWTKVDLNVNAKEKLEQNHFRWIEEASNLWNMHADMIERRFHIHSNKQNVRRRRGRATAQLGKEQHVNA